MVATDASSILSTVMCSNTLALRALCWGQPASAGVGSTCSATVLLVTERTFRGGLNLEVNLGLGIRRLNGTLGTAKIRISEDRVWLGPWGLSALRRPQERWVCRVPQGQRLRGFPR